MTTNPFTHVASAFTSAGELFGKLAECVAEQMAQQSALINSLEQRIAALEARPESTSPAPAAPLPTTPEKTPAPETAPQRQENPAPSTVVDTTGWFSVEDAAARGFKVKRGSVMKAPNAKNCEHGTKLYAVSGAGKKRVELPMGYVLMAKAPPAPVQEEKPTTPAPTPTPKTPAVMPAAAQTTEKPPAKAKRVETPNLDQGAVAVRSGKDRALTAAQAKLIWVLTGGTWDGKTEMNYAEKSSQTEIWSAVGFQAIGGEKFSVKYDTCTVTFKVIGKQLKWSVGA
jgi:hypothetical protein